MTDATAPAGTGPRRDSTPLIIAGIVGAVILGAVFFLSGAERPLKRGATGFDALVSWLKANEIEARAFNGGSMLKSHTLGLRILPLFDDDMTSPRAVPETREAMIDQTAEEDLRSGVYRGKLRSQPTLVILPKWRTGMRALGVAHQDLLIPEDRLRILLRQMGFDRPAIRRADGGFATERWRLAGDTIETTLLHAQTIDSGDCQVLVGTKGSALLLRCGTEEAPVAEETSEVENTSTSGSDKTRRTDPVHWILTDPDVMANHSLALGGNGQAALAIVNALKTDNPVIVDWTTARFSTDNPWQAERRDRTWEDFARMFRWPFAMIWIAFAIVGGLVLWRAVTRYGPLAPELAEEPLAAKTTAIDAKARLLRLTGHDAALLKTHITQRLAQLAADLLGPHRPAGADPMEALRPLVTRTNPDLAAELARLATLPQGADPLRHLDDFETCIDRIKHEFGRPTDLR
ncbi:MAG: hypothetical protein AAGB15_07145 [Pseudomonadota bacterium]